MTTGFIIQPIFNMQALCSFRDNVQVFIVKILFITTENSEFTSKALPILFISLLFSKGLRGHETTDIQD